MGKFLNNGMWGVFSPGLITTRQSHPVRGREACEFLNNGMWVVYSLRLVTTRQSHPARKFLNNGMWVVYSPPPVTTRQSHSVRAREFLNSLNPSNVIIIITITFPQLFTVVHNETTTVPISFNKTFNLSSATVPEHLQVNICTLYKHTYTINPSSTAVGGDTFTRPVTSLVRRLSRWIRCRWSSLTARSHIWRTWPTGLGWARSKHLFLLIPNWAHFS